MKKSLVVRSLICCILLTVVMITSVNFSSAATTATLVKSFSITSGGTGTRMRVGDLNSDGRLDFLVVQATSAVPSQVNMLTAYDHNGNQMWQIGTNNGISQTDRDEPVQIYDIDNDGQNEVLAVMNSKFRILNGSNGQLEKEYNLPYSTAHDCILISNLVGSAWPQDIILKDRYTRAYAMDKNFNVLWSYTGATGHYPWNYDFDNDGKDEIMMSYDFLESNGSKVWTASDATDHADCIQIGQLDGNTSNGLEIVLGTQGNYTVQCYGWTGNLKWRSNQLVEGQQVIIQNFRSDLSGLEVYGLDRVNRGSPGQDALFLFNSSGTLLWKENPPNNNGYGTAIKKVNNWDGTNTPYCMAFKRGGSLLPGLYNGNGTKVVEFPVDGNVMIGDFCGDSKQEVLIFTASTAYIYANGSVDYSQPAPNPGHMRPQLKEDYNFSRYGSGECLTVTGGSSPTPTPSAAVTPTPTPTPTGTTNLALNKTASADSSQSANPASRGNDGSTTTRWCAANGNTGHWWKVDLGSNRNITGSEVMWEFARNYKYKVEVSTDNSNWTLKVDKTGYTGTAQIQNDVFSATARYVRITVTGLTTSPTTWASFYEFRVFGN